MGVYDFKDRFVPFILDGSKTHTIRGERADGYRDEPGDIMHLYNKLRTKKRNLVMRAPCVRVEPIIITPGAMVRISGEWLEDDEREALARRDGFPDFAEMIAFWREPKNRLPFKGWVFHWNYVLRNKPEYVPRGKRS